MRLAFVHLSDIHFGQEVGGQVVVNNDVKQRLIEDCQRLLAERRPEVVAGVIVTGDIAYAGKQDEYDAAGQWLDKLTTAIGCARAAVRIVPGNHDIDRSRMSESTHDMLAAIVREGEDKLDKFLVHDTDRNQLFARFEAYRLFAEAYDCSLDSDGGLAGNHAYILGPGRTLRLVGMNSALVCAVKDQQGRLLLGKRQRVLPKAAGEELVVLTHHPLSWLQDSEDAKNYLQNRARVYLSGHEHTPHVQVIQVEDRCDLLMLAAGATMPPTIVGDYNYCYNILEFEWDQPTDDLLVTITPRAWQKTKTAFGPADHVLKGNGPKFKLGCPNFRDSQHASAAPTSQSSETAPAPEAAPIEMGADLEDQYSLLLLRFFRDLSEAQRIKALLDLRILPADWSGPLTHAVERRCLDQLRTAGRLPELHAIIDLLIATKT